MVFEGVSLLNISQANDSKPMNQEFGVTGIAWMAAAEGEQTSGQMEKLDPPSDVNLDVGDGSMIFKFRNRQTVRIAAESVRLHIYEQRQTDGLSTGV
jgi:hypothetical protein